jgi:hypothetical protein
VPAQPVDATVSNQLIRQCFSQHKGWLGQYVIQT